MAPVAGHLTAAGPTLPGHPVRPQDDVAAHRTGRRKQRTVNPLMVPARYNFLCSSQGRPCGRPPAAAVLGRQTQPRAVLPANDPRRVRLSRASGAIAKPPRVRHHVEDHCTRNASRVTPNRPSSGLLRVTASKTAKPHIMDQASKAGASTKNYLYTR